MSEHRYPCRAVPPVLPFAGLGHGHACIHDALHRPTLRMLEHRCECGMTWTELESEYDQAARESRTNERLGLFLILGFTMVGLMCVVGLGWQALH
jgi:hypothetical protein